MGLTLSLGAAALFVILDVLRKVLGSRMDSALIVIGINAGAALILGALVLGQGAPSFDGVFVLLSLIEGGLFAVTSLLYVRAVTLSPLSLTIPYLGFTPLVSALVALSVLGESPTFRGWLGIGLIVVGGILLHLEPGASLLRLLTAPLREPGSWRMLTVAVIWGLTTSVDKIAIAHGSELLLGFALSAVSALVLALSRLWKPRFEGGPPASPRTWALLALAAVVAGLAVLCQYFAYREMLVAYVEAIKRGGGLLSVVVGLTWFREGHAVRRFPAALLMLLGILMVAL